MNTLIGVLSLVLVARADYETNSNTDCFSCFISAVHCANEDFTYTHCCDYFDGTMALESCTRRFKYCTSNLEGYAIRHLTCPSKNCPEN